MQKEKIYIYGRHAVFEALTNTPHALKKVFISPNVSDPDLLVLLKERNVPTAPLKGTEVKADTGHQGLVGVVDTEKLLVPYAKFIAQLKPNKHTAVALLGGLHDPHNVGAIIRSAAAFGFSAVLVPEREQAPITGTVVKTSAGMVFRIPLITVPSITDTIRDLRALGFSTFGLDGDGSPLGTQSFDAPSLFIVGNEGSGMNAETKQLCDVVLSIPIHERTESLNAAAAAAVVMYQWSSKHPESLT